MVLSILIFEITHNQVYKNFSISRRKKANNIYGSKLQKNGHTFSYHIDRVGMPIFYSFYAIRVRIDNQWLAFQ